MDNTTAGLVNACRKQMLNMLVKDYFLLRQNYYQ